MAAIPVRVVTVARAKVPSHENPRIVKLVEAFPQASAGTVHTCVIKSEARA